MNCADDLQTLYPTTTPIQKEAIELFKQKQYRSCEIVARLILSKAKGNNDPLAIHLLGECAFATEQYAHARTFFARLYPLNENLYRFKEAQCLKEMGSLVEATSTLSGIPPSDRDLGTWMLLGNLNLATNRYEIAQASFLEALRINPYALEAAERLAELGVDSSPILSAMGSQVTQSDDFGPFKEIVKALSASGKHFLAMSLQTWYALAEQFPNNVYFLTNIAGILTKMNDKDGAERIFSKIRLLEDTQIDMMDRYALILALQGDIDGLVTLCDELLALDSKRPEGWTAYALYQEVIHNLDKALDLVDKAIALDNRNAFAYVRRGAILMESKRPEHASVAFFRACEIEREITSFEGLVDSYIAAGKFKEALAAAKEAISIAPRDTRAMTLVGRALASAALEDQSVSKRQQGLEKATRTLRKALTIDPSSLRPLFALVDLYSKMGEFETSIQLLKQGLEGNSAVQSDLKGQADILYMLGDTYAAIENHQSAMDCYHRALGINPRHREAQQGLDRLECLLRGVDPNDSQDMADHEQSVDGSDYYGGRLSY